MEIICSIVATVTMLCCITIAIKLNPERGRSLMARKIRRLKKKNQTLKRRLRAKEYVYWISHEGKFASSDELITHLELKNASLEKKLDTCRSFFHTVRDLELWCIDRNPKDVTKEWIDEHAFRFFEDPITKPQSE